MKLSYNFFVRDAATVAKALLGKTLVHHSGKKIMRVRIVETEAYVGTHDLACHASKGRTKRTEVLFGKAAHAYVYLIYGMYDLFNIVTGQEGDAQAVLIRAVEPLKNIQGKTDGPGKLSRAMGLTKAHNGLELLKKPIYCEDAELPKNIITTTRIGIDYAGEWKDAPLRFYDADSNLVSKKIKT